MFDFILFDIMMSGFSGFDVIKVLKFNFVLNNILVIFVIVLG